MIYTATLNPALDYVVNVEGGLIPGSINRAIREEIVFGGKGINVSTILHNLEIDTVALGFVAGFTGTALETGLDAQGISHDFIHLSEGMTRINIKVKGKEESEINGNGPEISETAKQELMHQIRRLKEGDILVLAGSIPSSLPDDIYEQMLKQLDHRKVLTVVDTTGERLKKVISYHPFLIKPNNLELGELFHKTLQTEEEIVLHAKELQRMGARNVLISMAGDGAILVDENGNVTKQLPCKGTVKNSVGAGDSMVAGFLAGYLETGDYTHALKLGTAAGGATAFSVGLAKKEQIMKLYQTIA